MNAVETENLKFKQYQFIKAKYFGYEILINKEDNYVNITKLLDMINEEHKNNSKPIKEFRKLKCNVDFKEYCDLLNEWVLRQNSVGAELYYEIHGNQYNNHISGTYIHPKLLNYVLMWADKKYAFYVSEIMEQLNNNNTNEVNKLVEELKECSIKVQTNELFDNSKIKLYKSKDSEPYYKLSYDQDKTLSKDLYELIDIFIVNSASNILKSDGIKQLYNKDKSKKEFYENNLKDIINYIRPSIKIHQN